MAPQIVGKLCGLYTGFRHTCNLVCFWAFKCPGSRAGRGMAARISAGWAVALGLGFVRGGGR